MIAAGQQYYLFEGDNRALMSNMGDDTIDAVVCDPPYELTSIVKRFGGPNAAPPQHGTDGAYARAARGFMSHRWDGTGISFDPALWAEVLRVLKPGGHLVAFSGTRTYHRMACAIEDAGFEIRDMLEWLYGSGFPKGGLDDEGRGSALKPAHEPMCLARKSFKGSAAGCVEAHGTGLLNIDACRIPGEAVKTFERCEGDRSREQYRTGTTVGPAVLIDRGRFPANVCHDGSPEVIAQFPAEAGAAAPVHKRGGDKFRNTYGAFSGNVDEAGRTFQGDSGSAARFFYCAKASRRDRNEGVDGLAGNIHPTVKPTELMRWLVRLVCPPGGVVFDPFTGSGSTGKAALIEGRRFIGAEMTAEYIPIARARIEYAARLTAGSN